ncbi:cellulose synthase subunit BcsC-related outer membrane protein [Xanthomonas bonasiae]|uniref:cellulose synthase subunit BcsC-related outer membrane protein n=1 Tax=Xanthomonas bonasiae TaxID=2810351 RepID=UPI0017825002|nr:cellulose synthase subunit BcsC-related outer membrane protein [Xanthomonas surreyensis]MBD7922605.1 BCSC C-terminal domain-containing protein [Xanthomonas surreyensis]
MFRMKLKPLYLAGMIDLCLLAGNAHAQAGNATQQLVSQGNYWHDQGRDDLAADTWRKLLRVDPNQPDALLGLAQIDLAQGRQGEARKRLQQLQKTHPQAPQTQRLSQAIGGSGDSVNLRNARRAASAGRYVEAVREYQALFDGKAPPDHLALEYYQALAGTPQGWDGARDGLRRLVAAQPNNGAAALALAQVLTYREPSRREGIAQLSAMSKRPDVGGPARAAWRQALLWLNAGNADAPLYQAFLAANPNDAEVAAKATKLGEQRAAQAGDPAGEQLGEAFKALNAGNLAVAEQRFTQVLRARPRDADALGGLGSVRLRQQRFGEAQELLRPAAAGNGKWRSALDSARYWLQLQQAQAARGRGDSDEALRLTQQSLKLQPNEATGYVLLGDLQSASDAAAAERSYRQALALSADNAGALQGLIGLYSRQGRADEASALFARLSPAQREKAGGEATLRSNVQRARAKQALEAGDTVSAQSELEAAMVERPGDPWVRLDLARLYQQAGRPDQARSVMDGLLAVHGDMPEALYANALLAQERGDWASAYASLERIPSAARTAEMSALRNTAWVEQQAAQARLLQQQGRAGEAQLLLARTEAALGGALEQPALLASMAGAYADIGSNQRALTLAQRLVAQNPSTEARLQYASVLLRAQQDAELAATLRQLRDTDMTAEQQRRYQALRSGYTLRQVDALRELGNLEAAYDALAPLLAQQNQDPKAVAALARLYAAAGDQRQALVLYQQQLQQSPNDLDTLIAAANTAAALRDLDSAEDYLQRALAQAPDSPAVLSAAGRVYRSAGKNRKAESYFRAALAAQAREAGQHDNGLPAANGPASFAGAGRPLNPFAGMSGRMPRSPAVVSDSLGGGYPAPAYAAAGQAALPAMPAAAGAGQYPSMPAAAAAAYATGGDDLPPPASAGAAGGVQLAALPVPGQRAPAAASLAPSYYPDDRVATTGSARQAQALATPARTGTVLDELREVQSENSDSLAAGATYRARDGEAGLGKLNDLEVPLHGEFAVGEGKLSVDVTPTLLDAGTLDTAYSTASRFGAGPSAAMGDALAADRTPIDDLVGSDLYQLLLTEGDTNATRNALRTYAVNTGLYNELYNDTDATLTNAQREAAALQALYAEPLSAFLLGNIAADVSISTLASAILGDASRSADLSAADIARFQALAANTTAASLTPAGFSQALYTMAANGSASRRMDQDASGVGVSVKYKRGGFAADLGSTPVGFPEQRIVGGVGYRGQIGENLTYSGQAFRRAVSDSLLSFAGVDDGRAGLSWGGVTSNGVRLSATLDNGLLGGYANLTADRLVGHNVADNDHRQVDLGVYVHALETENQSLTAGLNLTAMQYDKNLSGYTYGQGGYFSPQDYVDLGFPVHWSGRSAGRKVNWSVDASVGVQHFRSDDSNYFPTSAQMQQDAYDAASLAALLGLVDTYTAPVYAGQSKTGVSYNVAGAAEWQLAPQLFLGGRLIFNNARDYNQFSTNLYVRFVLDRLGAGLGRRPQVLASPYVGE